MSNQVNIFSDFVYQAETLTHEIRVLADSGTIDRLRDLDTNITNQKLISQYSNLQIGCGTSFGYKLTTGLVDKAYDYSGNNRDLTASGTARPTYNATGRTNKGSFTFDGTTDYLNSISLVMPNTGTVSFCSWVKCSTVANIQTLYNDLIQDASTGYFWLYRNTSTNNLIFRYATGASAATISFTNFWGTSGTTPLDNVWVHIAVVVNYTGNTISAYRNGILFSTQSLTTSIPPTLSGVKYFGNYQGVSHFLNGSMDDMRVYSSLLSASDAGRIMNEI